MSKKTKSTTTRRKFIGASIKTAAILPVLNSPLMANINISPKEQNQKFSKAKNILILGGTSFLGPHQIAYALNRGHKVSIFTRGKTEPSVHRSLFKEVEKLVGDRENDLEALTARWRWSRIKPCSTQSLPGMKPVPKQPLMPIPN